MIHSRQQVAIAVGIGSGIGALLELGAHVGGGVGLAAGAAGVEPGGCVAGVDALVGHRGLDGVGALGGVVAAAAAPVGHGGVDPAQPGLGRGLTGLLARV